MVKDYDAPLKNDDEEEADSLEELKARRAETSSSAEVDEDENEVAEGFELPGADLSNEELSVEVVPAQDDEFTCTVCFLVHHISQLANGDMAAPVCADCSE